jgi:hypothetical protein
VSIGPTFLGGAQSRLLPLSVPFRFFIASCLFQIAFWVLVGSNADSISGFEGGLGEVLGTLHTLTIGVLFVAAIGASLQLLPVATRQGARSEWPAHLLSILVLGGSPVFLWGMMNADFDAMVLGGGALSAGLILYLIVMGDTLIKGKGLGVVIVYAWFAFISLLLLAGLGLLLALDYELGYLTDHMDWALIHFVIAVFGFMGLLAMGFSYILVPMFSLSASVPNSRAYTILGLAILAMFFAIFGVVEHFEYLILASIVVGAGASGIYVHTMFAVLSSGMRKRLGPSFILIRSSWVFLIFSAVVGLFVWSNLIDGLSWAVFGWVVLVGWLLTFLIGILLRISPFLASMHSTVGGGRPARLSNLTPDWQQKVIVAFHPIAFLSVSCGMVLDQVALVQLGAISGTISALALLVYVLDVVIRLLSHRRLAG